MECEDNIYEIRIGNSESVTSPMQEDPGTSGVTPYTEEVHNEKFAMLYNSIQFLMNIQGMEWKEEWEQQFVNMRDMTKELKAYCDFLVDLNFPHLVAKIVKFYYKESRLMKILRIFFDLFCQNRLLNHNANPDIDIQVFKFFGQIWVNGNSNSVHCVVLYEMLSCLAEMMWAIELPEAINKRGPFFLKHCVEAYKQVYIDIDEEKDNGATFSFRQYNCFYNLMQIVEWVHISIDPGNQRKAIFILASESLLSEMSTMFKLLSHIPYEIFESLKYPFSVVHSFSYFLSEVHLIPYTKAVCLKACSKL